MLSDVNHLCDRDLQMGEIKERDTCDGYRDRKHPGIPDISRRYQLIHLIAADDK